ncbi:CPBP family glutamic-type intramembrane protease [Halobacterium salinarum]|uniref:CPBP family glutamic-type intramembrane protease n=1 Tax=Halobacterium salinarum TaxID=2242 RepID=UPI00255532F8|nr:CPBP family glutamic-type intramembrane protease [Halobacterium salinarum]MDL0128535.1 CPBP family glutamic-type intramembrane protease [Halobacterium salinarum]
MLGVLVGWPLTMVIADSLGVARHAPPSLTTTTGLVGFGFGAVGVAAVVEEVLYRGLLAGIALSRGYGPLLVGIGSLLVFAVVHVFTTGIAGIVMPRISRTRRQLWCSQHQPYHDTVNSPDVWWFTRVDRIKTGQVS